jgi:hypothetical protein
MTMSKRDPTLPLYLRGFSLSLSQFLSLVARLRSFVLWQTDSVVRSE